MDGLCAALSAMWLSLHEIIETTFSFEQAGEAIQSIWEGKHIGKLVVGF
jgi:hypothetical protein